MTIRGYMDSLRGDSQTGTYGPQVTVKYTRIVHKGNYDAELAKLER